jgi:hypothetical protein
MLIYNYLNGLVNLKNIFIFPLLAEWRKLTAESLLIENHFSADRGRLLRQVGSGPLGPNRD